MYPYDLFLGLDLYTILMIAGVFICMCFIRWQADWRGLRARLQNLILFNTVAAVVLGYGGAVLLQAFYNYMAKGKFEIVKSTGATFYGGLIGGTAIFILIYFVAGHLLFPDGYHKAHFRTVSDLAPAAITVAHGFGRLGCLMAGCCYGAKCDAWYGIEMVRLGYKVIPVQLFEAMFLLVLSIILLLTFKRGKRYQMPAYMMAYAVWRFFAETMRADYRGESLVKALSPSQLISVLLLAGGLVLLGIELFLDDRKKAKVAAGVEETASKEAASEEAVSDETTSVEAASVEAASVEAPSEEATDTPDEGALSKGAFSKGEDE